MKIFKAFIFLLFTATICQARTWTAADGRTLEGDFIRMQGESVVVKIKGREVPIALDKLSQEDRDFVAEMKDEPDDDQSNTPAPAPGSMVLFGTDLKAGATSEVETDLPEDVQRALRGNDLDPTKLKMKISLPAGFDATKPQNVYWTVGGINNEGERLKGNLGVFGMGNGAAQKGWVVIAADTEHGNPRETTIAECKGDLELHEFVVEELTKIWPDFKTWKHAAGGHSSGAKATFFRIAHLLKADVNVVGAYISGCNHAYPGEAKSEAHVSGSGFRNVKAFQSTGEKDELVNAAQAGEVSGAIKGGGMRNLKAETHDGGHVFNQDHFAKALEWFASDEK